MIQNLENKIKKFNNQEIAFSAFLGIALPIALTPVVGALALMTSSIAIPFLINGLINRKVFKQGKTLNVFESFTSQQYRKIFRQWLIEYVNSSENITEKKYKLFFTKMWLDSKTLNFKDYISSTDPFITSLGEQIKNYDNSHYNIVYSFLYEKNDVDFCIFINEENDLSKKINTIKSVYKDFENLGLLGQNINFMTISSFQVLAFIQDYQFSESDVAILKKKEQIAQKEQHGEKKSKYSSLNQLYLYDSDLETINKFIEHGNLVTLKALKNVFTHISLGNNYHNTINIDNINLRIDKQLQYVSLENNLPKKDHIIKNTRKL